MMRSLSPPGGTLLAGGHIATSDAAVWAIEALYRKPNFSAGDAPAILCIRTCCADLMSRPNQVWAMDITYSRWNDVHVPSRSDGLA